MDDGKKNEPSPGLWGYIDRKTVEKLAAEIAIVPAIRTDDKPEDALKYIAKTLVSLSDEGSRMDLFMRAAGTWCGGTIASERLKRLDALCRVLGGDRRKLRDLLKRNSLI